LKSLYYDARSEKHQILYFVSRTQGRLFFIANIVMQFLQLVQ